MMKYKGYVGHFTFDEKQNLFLGRVANTHDPITFQGKSVQALHQSFCDAVNEYLEWCEKYGKALEKPRPLEEWALFLLFMDTPLIFWYFKNRSSKKKKKPVWKKPWLGKKSSTALQES